MLPTLKSNLDLYQSIADQSKKRFIACGQFFLIILMSLLASCSRSPPTFLHSFNFDVNFDSPDMNHPEVEVLDFRYGASGTPGTRAQKERVAIGDTFGRIRTTGYMPKGEELYVKWRVKSTQAVYEDTVDLRNLLPKDMTNCGVHFIVKGPQLYVYVVPPPGEWDARRELIEPGYILKHQIYPATKH